jgi:hypothetical protein
MRKCFDRHNCDKGKRHGYERVYEPVFSPVRDQPITLLEIGVFRGASLQAWLDYFPHATVIGVDTFQRVRPGRIEALRHPRVKWFQCDSTQDYPTIEPVDFIIDDGCHDPEAQRATLANFLPLLKAGGRYFIEDAPTLKIPGAKVHDLRKGGQFDSRILEVVHV